jgi:hypothetical protein
VPNATESYGDQEPIPNDARSHHANIVALLRTLTIQNLADRGLEPIAAIASFAVFCTKFSGDVGVRQALGVTAGEVGAGVSFGIILPGITLPVNGGKDPFAPLVISISARDALAARATG